MITSKVTYLGNLRTSCEHIQSGTKIITDAPVDNHGNGEAFSPTDLVATAYASCMITIIGIYCQNHQYPFEHADAAVTKIMASNPRRIDKVIIDLDLSGNGWDETTQKKIEAAGRACPIAKTLEGNVTAEIIFKF